MQTLGTQTVFVSGSSKGIGLGITKAFVEMGAKVIVHSRSEASATEAQHNAGAAGAVWGELHNAEGCDQVLTQLKAFSPIDILVNNAGNLRRRGLL
jgi:NAD(P)-dependent dehydrogenase (short-subunit alcohol dehydrogenase family)